MTAAVNYLLVVGRVHIERVTNKHPLGVDISESREHLSAKVENETIYQTAGVITHRPRSEKERIGWCFFFNEENIVRTLQKRGRET